MKLYYFPSPNPQKIRFALNELGLDCETVAVDLTKGEQRAPEFLALNPCARVPVLVDGELKLWESHAILAYLGEKTGRLWPTTAAGRADAIRWLFFLSGADFSARDRAGVQPDRSEVQRRHARRGRDRARRKGVGGADPNRRRAPGESSSGCSATNSRWSTATTVPFST